MFIFSEQYVTTMKSDEKLTIKVRKRYDAAGFNELNYIL